MYTILYIIGDNVHYCIQYSPASFLVLRGFRSIQPGGLASSEHADTCTQSGSSNLDQTVSWRAYLCSSSALRNLSEPPTLTFIIPL